MQHGIQYRVVGLGLDGYPFRGTGAGHRQVGFKLYAFHAALAGISVAPHAGDAPGGVDVAAERNQVFTAGRIRQDGKGPVPEFAEHVLGVVTLDRAAGAQALVERPPGEQQRRKTAHVFEGRRGTAGGEGQARVAVLIHNALGPGCVHLVCDDIQSLIPAYLYPTGFFVAALLGVGALHGSF